MKNKTSLWNQDRIRLMMEVYSDQFYLWHYMYQNDCANMFKDGAAEKLYGDRIDSYEEMGITFNDFAHIIRTGRWGEGGKPGRWSTYVLRKDFGRSGLSRYRKKPNHRKKEEKPLEEQQLREVRESWRIRRGVKRDKAKRSKGHGRRKTFYKRNAARRLRQYFRETLPRERFWGTLIRGRDLKKFPAYDPWRWN